MKQRLLVALLAVFSLLVGVIAVGGLLGGEDVYTVASTLDDGTSAELSAPNENPDTPGPVLVSTDDGGSAHSEKIDVCHVSGNGKVKVLNVDEIALPDHRGHGDAIPGELVPGSMTLVYDSTCAPVSFGISVEKATNGDDADSPTGPLVLVGDPVNWTYVVTNTGDATLVGVAVNDDQGVVVTCPDTTLGAGDVMTCTASGPAVAGQYANVGTASAVTAGVAGDEQYLIPANQGQATDGDPSHYFGAGPGIAIEKATNGQDADEAPGPSIFVDDPVTWTYVVTNTGNVSLDPVVVTDDQGVAVSCPDTALDPGESLTCTASGTATFGPYANVGTATGTPSVGPDVTDSDTSNYLGVDPIPELTIEKSTEDRDGVFQDADTAPGPFLISGATVSWRYEITNTGNVTVTGIVVTDSVEGVISCPNDTLDPGESMTCFETGTVLAGQYENVASAFGVTAEGAEAEATDPSHYFGTRSAITIEKSTNGVDADTAPGPQIFEGAAVTWTYLVSNDGLDPLDNVVVTDSDPGVSVSCPQSTLDPNESMICTAGGVAALGQYSNTGSATATAAGSNIGVTDSDDSHYLGVPEPDPSIDIEKYTNGNDADTVGSGPTLTVGAPVTWRYDVTNTGNVPLFPVIVTDSDGSLTLDCTSLDQDGPLQPGETRSCTATGTVVDTSGLPGGDYENTGTATGTPADAQGDPIGLPDVAASDLSHYTSTTDATDAIDLEKFTEDRNGVLRNADSPPGPTLYIGDTVGWVYVVTNTGSTPLSDITVTDDQGVAVTCLNDDGDDANGLAVLLPGGILRCSASGTVVAGPYVNEGTATGEIDGTIVSDSDTSNHVGVQAPAGIDIEKATNGADADAAPGPALQVGDAVTWTYVVTNRGAADLTDVTVTDNDGSLVIVCDGGIPDPFPSGDSFTCTATGTAGPGQYQNIGRATGKAGNQMVTDSDRSHYSAPLPEGAAVQIEKLTNDADADDPDGNDVPSIPEGQQVTWKYRVTNTGGENLFNVIVTDDQLGEVCNLTLGSGNTAPFLAPNDSAECTATGTAVDTSNFVEPNGVYANVGTVTADPEGGGSAVSDSDPSHYRGLGPVTIDIEKATNGVDADNRPTTVVAGSAVTWSYVVTNTSDVPLEDITVVDDREGPVTCPLSTLQSGESMTCTSITGVAINNGSYTNIATATATSADGRIASDSDRSRYVVTAAAPAVDIEKSTNGIDADDGPGPDIVVGTTVTWTYRITNTGNVELSLGGGAIYTVAVTDDQGVVVVCPFVTLAPLETATCTGTGTATLGAYVNVGTAEVTQFNVGVVATDSDTSHYTGVELGGGRD